MLQARAGTHLAIVTCSVSAPAFGEPMEGGVRLLLSARCCFAGAWNPQQPLTDAVSVVRVSLCSPG